MRQSAELVRAARMRMQQEEQARSRRRRRSVFGLARVLGGCDSRRPFYLPGKCSTLMATRILRDRMRYYKDLGVPAVGNNKPEHQADAVENLLAEVSPDVLEFQGDALKRKGSDRASVELLEPEHYVNAVRRARRYENDLDGPVIVAGHASRPKALMKPAPAPAPRRVTLLHGPRSLAEG